MTRRGKPVGKAVANLVPATLEEAEARAYARESACMVRDEKISFFDIPLSWFNRPDSVRWWKQWLRITARTPGGLIDLCDDALAGDRLAHEVACDLIGEFKHARAELPYALEVYNMRIVRDAAGDPEGRPEPRRGRPKGGSPPISLRDLAILWMVGDLRWKFGMNAMRKQASKRPHLNACAIVARALADEKLAIGEDTVKAVWTRFGRRAFPPETLARPHFG